MLRLAPLRVVLWSLLYCGALMSCGLACGTLCFVLMLCICSVSVLRWRDRYHAALFFVVSLCCVALCCVVLCCVVLALHKRYDMGPHATLLCGDILCGLGVEWCGVVVSDFCLLGCLFVHSFVLCLYGLCWFLLL